MHGSQIYIVCIIIVFSKYHFLKSAYVYLLCRSRSNNKSYRRIYENLQSSFRFGYIDQIDIDTSFKEINVQPWDRKALARRNSAYWSARFTSYIDDLGTKPFFLGDSAITVNAVTRVFGLLADLTHCMSEAWSYKLLKNDLKNLDDFVERMKNIYWSDWNELIQGKPNTNKFCS